MATPAKLIAEIAANFDFADFQNTAYTLADIEKRSSYDDFARSAGYCAEKLKALGFSDVRRYAHRADGVSAAFDCVMPQAWSLDPKKRSFLEIANGDVPGCGRVLADSSVRPLSANIWSAPTPKGGVTAELVSIDALPADDWSAARGKWVLFAPTPGSACPGFNRRLADVGIAGLVRCNMANECEMPDDLGWYNGNGHCGWYLTKDDPRFPVFSISPRQARALLRALPGRRIELHGEMNCRVYNGEIETVTGTIPGESADEIALFAHLYEPFVADNAAGAAFLCEFGHQLLKRGVKLRKTLRVVLSMELYGMAAYLEKHGKNIVLAANFDGGAPRLESANLLVRRSPFFRASFSDWIVLDLLKKNITKYPVTEEAASLSDDTFTPDPYFHGGIPVFWIHSPCDKAHHSTGYLFAPDWAAARDQVPVMCAAVETLLTLDALPDFAPRAEKEFRTAARRILSDQTLSPFAKEMRLEAEYLRQANRLASATRFTGQPVRTAELENLFAAARARIARKTVEPTAIERRAMAMTVKAGRYGFPFSLGRIPFAERRPVAIPRTVWCLLDGKRPLLSAIRMAEAESGTVTSPEKITRIIADCEYVARYGYASVKG